MYMGTLETERILMLFNLSHINALTLENLSVLLIPTPPPRPAVQRFHLLQLWRERARAVFTKWPPLRDGHTAAPLTGC
jgi:hypothetical protein